MSWLKQLVDQHSEMESPRNFWYWAGLSAISAVLKDNVWLHRGSKRFKLYPNIYVIFHAESGLKKGPPINLAADLVKLVNNTRLIKGRSSIQGIMKRLGTGHTVPGGKPVLKSHGFICSSELSSSLVNDPAALTILTDLYDRQYNQGDWESLLKMEDFQLRDPTVSLLGGINDAHAEVLFEKKDIQGGFLARTFIIYEKEEQTVNSLAHWLINPPNAEQLSEYLKELSRLNGPFKDLACEEDNKLTEVGEFYDEWYNTTKAQVKEMKVKDETGTLNRLGDSVLKVAMLLSLSKKAKLELDLESMEEAVKSCERLIGNIRQTTLGKRGISTSSSVKTLIIKELMARENHRVSKPILMKKMWMHYSTAEEWDEIMISLHESGIIRITNLGPTVIYEMPDSQYEELAAFFVGKNK